MFRFTKKSSGNAGVLFLEGDLTINNAGKLKSALQSALDKVATVEIKFSKVTEIDLSCLQLLCSAHRESVLSDRKLKFAPRKPSSISALITSAGLPRYRGCSAKSYKNCLWIEEIPNE